MGRYRPPRRNFSWTALAVAVAVTALLLWAMLTIADR